MKIYPSTVKVLLPPTSILNQLQSHRLTLSKENVVEFVRLHLQKLNSNQALHVLSNLISQGLVTYEDAEYEVESVEDHSWDEAEGSMYYLIKWRGWPIECSTWERDADLVNCQELLAEYKNLISGKSRKRGPAVESSDSAERSKARVVQLLDCINFDGLTPERFERALSETLTKRVLQSVGNRRSLPAKLVQRSAQDISSKRSGAYRRLADKMLRELRTWEDLLNAKEPQARIVVENKVDLEGPPWAFRYETQRLPGPGVSIPSDPVLGCRCKDCYGERHSCMISHVHNEGKVPYTRQGRLSNVTAGYPIHECNSLCDCGPDCPFRVVQKGRRTGLAIFRTRNRGWGVRTLQRIPRGAFVVEYVGEVVTSEEAERRGLQYDREGQTYLFDLDLDGDPVYSVDARDCGNVAHFLNHSCSPNLAIRCVYTQCIDKDLPLLALFAVESIATGTELTFDYQMSGSTGAAGEQQQQKHQEQQQQQQEQQQEQQEQQQEQQQQQLEHQEQEQQQEQQQQQQEQTNGPEKIRCLCGSSACRGFLFD